jgi:hypothetical protein
MTTQLKSFADRAVGSIKQGTAMLVVTNMLSKIGFQITPYYLTLESNRGNPK